MLGEIKAFLEGYNQDLKYLVNVETDPNTNYAECIIHEPGTDPKIVKIQYEPFMYTKDLEKLNHFLYPGKSETLKESLKVKHGITITKLKTGNQKRLVNGFCYKVTSHKSFNSIVDYFGDGGINPFQKLKDHEGRDIKDSKGKVKFVNGDLFYNLRLAEQFFVSTQTRLYKGIEEYKNIHKLTFDIETTGLRYQISRIISIGIRDNRGFEVTLEPKKLDDDECEIKLIQDFFNVIDHIKPAVICGYNSEMFDFDFIIGRAKLLKMNLEAIPTGLRNDVHLRRRPNTSVKYGNTPDRYTATEMWGYSIIDILHAVKRTAAVNSEIKENKLKYIAKLEKIAKPNRTYIPGEDNSIGRFYSENKMFVIDEKNNYMQIPEEFQYVTRNLYILQANKQQFIDEEYKATRKKYLDGTPTFYEWFKKEALPKSMISLISGKKLVKQYLLDDLWETEQVDELYNQSSFLLAKIVPTTYQRICTMGTAGVWNLLMTAWSYENDLAIPYPDTYQKFSGGLVRTYKSGYVKRIKKIDYASLYPMVQLTEGVFPIFDITGVLKKLLLYLTTTRNIYKKMANGSELNNEEVTLLRQIDHEAHVKYINKELKSTDTSSFKIKQLPIKILNNSLYGALGSHISFNWSDNICASRITCTGRLHLRHAISWFNGYGCTPLLAVTDGVNFHFPERTNIYVDDTLYENEAFQTVMQEDGPIETMWKYGGKTGVAALIEKFNKEEMKPPFMSVDDDGEFVSCLNLARINYATLALVPDKKTGELKEKIKLTGNTIKSKVMPEYIEEFINNGFKLILNGKGKEFFDYYNDYAANIYYQQIPLKKIANKNRIKTTIAAYKKRGKDKNGRDKGMQAHMELIIQQREELAEKLFEEHKHEFDLTKIKNLNIDVKMKLVANYMPPEPELDSVIYYYNTGTKKSAGSSSAIVDPETGKKIYNSKIITADELLENPNMTGDYNAIKYLSAFNERVSTILVGFDPEVAKKMLSKVVKIKKSKEYEFIQADFPSYQLELKSFDLNDLDESMYLEEMEVNFWNRTGYEPKKVWDGFKVFDDLKIHYEIYDNALNFLNEKMTAANKPRIKSINDDYKDGDLVLIKNGSEYNVAAFNGVYMEIVRENIDVPKSEIEIELDRKHEAEMAKLRELEIASANKSEREKQLDYLQYNRIKYFDRFKKRFKIPAQMTMDELFALEETASKTFDLFIHEIEKNINLEDLDEYDEYLDDEDDSND